MSLFSEEECSYLGIFGPHPNHDIVGHGAYTTTHGKVRQMYPRNKCDQSFSETAGTPPTNRLDDEI